MIKESLEINRLLLNVSISFTFILIFFFFFFAYSAVLAFLKIPVFYYYHFTYVGELLLAILRIDVLATNSFSAQLSESMFISPLVMNDSFAKYRMWGWQFLSFLTWKSFCYFLLHAMVWDEESAVTSIGALFVDDVPFLFEFLKRFFSLSLFFQGLLWCVTVGVDFFGFILLGSCLASWMGRFMYFMYQKLTKKQGIFILMNFNMSIFNFVLFFFVHSKKYLPTQVHDIFFCSPPHRHLRICEVLAFELRSLIPLT